MLTSRRRGFLSFVVLLLGGALLAAESPVEPLPVPLSNNAVTALKMKGQLFLFSFMGIGAKKTWDAVSTSTYAVSTEGEKWTELRPVPGPAGRLGAAAISGAEQIFLFGGYVLDSQGGEVTVSDGNVYEPQTGRWYRAADMPVAVDDSVIGMYRGRFVYLIGGWSKTQAVRNVQIYDAEKNTWQQGTPIGGTPVFGHAGALVGDTIIYVDGAYTNPAGAKPKFIASAECWMGKIDHHDPAKITWSKLSAHPGAARYRIAAGGSEKDDKVYFSGGSSTPYDYNGIGYDGNPAEPSAVTFAYNLHSGKWEVINENTPEPTMDHRGMVVTAQSLVMIGGMEKNQKVTGRVSVIPKRVK